jgi:SynChlorMet cassette radical SAM/SPASM protein ScmF
MPLKRSSVPAWPSGSNADVAAATILDHRGVSKSPLQRTKATQSVNRWMAQGNMGDKLVPSADSMSYPLEQIYFYITNGCNLACRHCWMDSKFQGHSIPCRMLDMDLFRKVIKEAKGLGLNSVKLTGGEPLLHPHFMEMVEFTHSEGLFLRVETNGILCTPQVARNLGSKEDTAVALSLDGANARTHDWIRGVEGAFEGALAGFRNLVDAGLPPEIIMVLVHRNRQQMTDVMSLAASLGARSVKFTLVQPVGRGEKLPEGEALSIEELVDLGYWVENILPSQATLPVYFEHPLAFQPLNRFTEHGRGRCVCGIHYSLGVLTDGSYSVCGIGEVEPDLMFGHAARDSLEKVWKDTLLLRELREGLPAKLEGVCRDCVMRTICLGNCAAHNYHRSGNLFAPFWYCEQALEKGLFPRTRLTPEVKQGAPYPQTI